MTYTANQIEQAFENSEKYFYWEGLTYGKPAGDLYLHGEFVPYKILDSKSGTEGDWETEVFVVIKVGDQTFRKTGTYASHAGTEWDGPLEEVEPAEQVVTVWKAKK